MGDSNFIPPREGQPPGPMNQTHYKSKQIEIIMHTFWNRQSVKYELMDYH
jgi:hypothetical protein